MFSTKKTALATILSITSTVTLACTGFAIEAPDGTNVFSFNSENDITFAPALTTIEAGTAFKSDYQNPSNALEFTTQYDIVGIGPLGDIGTAMNSEGMAGSVFNLWGTEYNKVNSEDKNVLYILDIHKYVLGNAKTVDEAEALLRNVKVGKSVWVTVKEKMQVELTPEFQVAYQDKNGDKAVFYWLDGELVVTRDADGTVANTVQPELIEMQKSLSFDHSYKGNLEGLNGAIDSKSRYARAYVYSKEAQKFTENGSDAVRQAMKVSDALTLPKGIQTGYAGHPKATYYHTVFNLDEGVMYYKTKDQFNWTPIQLSKVKFDGIQTLSTQ